MIHPLENPSLTINGSIRSLGIFFVFICLFVYISWIEISILSAAKKDGVRKYTKL